MGNCQGICIISRDEIPDIFPSNEIHWPKVKEAVGGMFAKSRQIKLQQFIRVVSGT